MAHYQSSFDWDLFEVGDAFYVIDYGIMFPHNMDKDRIEDLNVVIVKLFEVGFIHS